MTDQINTALSICVDKVLDHVGASEQIRWNHVEKGLIAEVVKNSTLPITSAQDDVRCHYFGSWCEGTTIKGLASDIDMLYYNTNIPAVEKISGRISNSHLIVNDGSTNPGYVKLQMVKDGKLLFANVTVPNKHSPICTDKIGRVCISNYLPSEEEMEGTEYVLFLGLKHERRGPAYTSYTPLVNLNITETDHVFAKRCSTIPSFTSGWINRHRNYGWPSKQLLDKISQYGCFLVPKGHPSSQTEHLEWRISFSFQERELMFSLNSTQHKCYILLKMIKQYVISKTNTQSISSYHLKTALFYTIENNPNHIWIPDNIVYCTELCLKQLLDWLTNENCPNFFVPEENMFDKLSSDVIENAAKFIRDMLKSDGQYLKLLTCDKFGELLQESLLGKVLSSVSRDAIEFDLDNKMRLSMISIIESNKLTISANDSCPLGRLSALKLLLEQIRKSEDRLTSERVLREIKKGLGLILPNIHLQIAQTIAAIRLVEADTDKKRELMQDFDHHINQANGFAVFSQRLIKASMALRENKLGECAKILCDCEESLSDKTVTVCACRHYRKNAKMMGIENMTSMSPLEFHRTCVAPCLVFLPSQADLVPTPLQYEMYRSVGADTDTINRYTDYWFGVIAIDAQLYMFFLQFLVYTKLNKHELAEGVKWKLLNCLVEGLSTRHGITVHLETGFNLLGWMFKQENELELAAFSFLVSWKIRPDHNAAKWHMIVMIYEQYIQTLRS